MFQHYRGPRGGRGINPLVSTMFPTQFTSVFVVFRDFRDAYKKYKCDSLKTYILFHFSIFIYYKNDFFHLL